MKKKLVYLLAIGILSLLIFLFLAHLQEQKRDEQSTNRKKVFCEEIRVGMDMDEIRPILAKFGIYDEIPEMINNTPFRILIIYESPEAIERFGGSDIYLNFNGERLSSVTEFITGDMDMQRSVCSDQD